MFLWNSVSSKVKFKENKKENNFNIFRLENIKDIVKILVYIMKGKSDFEAVELNYVDFYESYS